MNPGLPDWMFAAFAIGGWEVFDWLATHFQYPNFRYIGGGIAGVCILVVLVRYVIRFFRRFKKKEDPDPDEWKNY